VQFKLTNDWNMMVSMIFSAYRF